jgi:hypothetical protein
LIHHPSVSFLSVLTVMRLFHFVFALTSAVFVAASVGQLFGLHSPANPSSMSRPGPDFLSPAMSAVSR